MDNERIFFCVSSSSSRLTSAQTFYCHKTGVKGGVNLKNFPNIRRWYTINLFSFIFRFFYVGKLGMKMEPTHTHTQIPKQCECAKQKSIIFGYILRVFIADTWDTVK